MSELQQTLRDLHRELAGRHPARPGTACDARGRPGGHPAGAGASERAGNVPASPDVTQDIAPADALEGAAVRLETDHPGLAGAVRAFVDALAKAGI